MTNKEAIKYLQQLYPNGGHCWLDEQRIEAIGIAINALQEEPVNDKLHEFEKEFFSIVNPYRNSHNYKGICVNLINWQHNLWRWLYWKENKKEPVSEDLMDGQ